MMNIHKLMKRKETLLYKTIAPAFKMSVGYKIMTNEVGEVYVYIGKTLQQREIMTGVQDGKVYEGRLSIQNGEVLRITTSSSLRTVEIYTSTHGAT